MGEEERLGVGTVGIRGGDSSISSSLIMREVVVVGIIVR